MPNSGDGSGSYQEALQELGRLLTDLRERAGAPSYRQIRKRGVELFGAGEAVSEQSMSGALAGRSRPRSLARLLWLVRTLQSYPAGPDQEREDLLLGPYLDLWNALEALRRPAASADQNAASESGSVFNGPVFHEPVAGSHFTWREESSEGDGLAPGSPGPVIDPDDDWPRRR